MVLIVLIVGVLATSGAVLGVDRAQQRLAAQAMDHYIDDVSTVVADQVSHYGDALTDLAAGISSQERLTKTDFNAMTAALDRRRLPGASGVTFVVPAFDAQIPATQAYWRARGATGLSLYPTGTDLEHDFVIFTRSFTGSAQNPGRDLAQTLETGDPLRISRETGYFTLGNAHVLMRDRALPADQQQLSFTVAVPVYGQPGTAGATTVRGWVAMGVRGGDFLAETLRNQAQGEIQLELDDPAVTDTTVIAAVTGGTVLRIPGLNRSRVIEVGQHVWRITMRPTTTLLSATDRRAAQLTLLAGIVVTALLAILVGVLAGARARAMDRVDVATAALRRDIERRQALEKELQRLAFHDSLTGLSNRTLFYDRVGQAMRTHTRGDETFAVFFIDLDGFKQVNDELGHGAGDTVLCEVADRLRECLRDSDTVARFGGDEFAVILERVGTPEDVHILAERIVHAVRQPIDVGSREVTVTASVGVALNRAGDTADDILREADLAMYSAKTTGKSRHVMAGAR